MGIDVLARGSDGYEANRGAFNVLLSQEPAGIVTPRDARDVAEAIAYAKAIPNLLLETSRAPIFEIATAVRELGPDKVVWGTDSPFVDYEWEFKKMSRVSDSREAYELVVGGNIARLLGVVA